NVSLPNGTPIDGSDFATPNEFVAQFERGLAAQIDSQLAQTRSFRFYQAQHLAPRSQIQQDLAALYAGVEQFHVFHSSGAYYGASGWARLQRNLNISNRAFPILMPRSDKNFWQNVGEEQAWAQTGTPYLLDAQLIDPASDVTLRRPDLVSTENISFGLPGITAGQIGQGKVVFMGNVAYPSVLACPDSFWGSKALKISGTTCSFNDNGLTDATASPMYDGGNMERFMRNLFTWLAPSYNKGSNTLTLGTNIDSALKFEHGHQVSDYSGWMFPFFVDARFNIDLQMLNSGGFAGLDPASTPVLLLQSYAIAGFGNGQEIKTLSDTSQPKLTTDDVTALIHYVDQGGNIVFMDAIEQLNPEPIAKLADAAGVALGGDNVAQSTTRQGYCGNGYYCQGNVTPNVHADTQQDLVVYEYIAKEELTPEYVTINQDGTLTWHKAPKPAIATYTVDGTDSAGNPVTVSKQAFIRVSNEAEKQTAIAELQANFPQTAVCSDAYPYELGCIEVRSGHQIAAYGSYHRPNFTRYHINSEILGSMVKAANLGTNVTKLFEHELYYRSKGKAGTRLSSTELQQTYDNFSVWMWNDEPYRYEADLADELGFKTAVEFLNCYSNDQHGGNSPCAPQLREKLVNHGFLHANGELNPSYPLN
ncbi:MAG: DUF4092 domain-containing protein, partial [Aeromonas sp.]